jgi:hypothetical protein
MREEILCVVVSDTTNKDQDSRATIMERVTMKSTIRIIATRLSHHQQGRNKSLLLPRGKSGGLVSW